MHLSRIISVFLVVFLLFPHAAFAADLTLTAIGGLDTSGAKYSHWWYTSTNVVLTGTTTASEVVTIVIDDVSATTSADTGGNWSYATTLTEGDHSVALSSPTGGLYSFTLTTGSDVPADTGIENSTGTTTATDQLPDAGFGLPTVMLTLLGLGGLVSPFILRKQIV